ncbi:Nuclear pore complex protein [Termitomyces sp. J132]|nr:Nuclear pore complex protein [Termitomyces sp. J132]
MSLYGSYADVLSVSNAVRDDLLALFDPETGFAPRMRQVCRDQLQIIDDTWETHELDAELLRMEERTWGLLQAVMPARKTNPTDLPNPRALLAQNPYTPTSTLAQAIMGHSPLLTELVVVREWLQETAPSPLGPEATTGYWRFTKLGVMQALRSGGPARDALVSRMDPDVCAREKSAGLAVDDANYEKNLAMALYACVRAGRIDDAVEMCRKANQPWKAASIRGARLFQWPAISTEEIDHEEDDDDLDLSSGNRQRKLWKSTCIRAALSTNLPEYERVLYAALAPSQQTVAVLKTACRTWEDYLWAQVCVLCEERESGEMDRLGGGFWEGGMEGDTDGEEESEWVARVAETLEALKDVAVVEGLGSEHAFHYSQLHIILDKTEMMIENFADALRSGSLPVSSREHAPLCRFFAHLCLYFQMIDIPVPPLATQVILESYLQVLEAAGQRELIALYAGALGDNAVERYAMFLVSLELSADMSERRLALMRARDHGLDMDRVAVATAERTIEKAFEARAQFLCWMYTDFFSSQALPPLRGSLPSIIALQPPPTRPELLLVRSIEWTTFHESTFPTALEQANVIMRYFLASGRVTLARQLLDMLPPELAAIGEPEEMATEYLHYRQFFVIWETLDKVVESQALEVARMNRDTRLAWLDDYRGLIDRAHERITKLLESEWLVTDVETPGGNRRRRELIRVRQIYVPELIIRLHSLLVGSRHHIKENLSRALHLVNTVADLRYKLYEDFVNEDGRRLDDYLGAVRQAVLAGLETGGSDPFRVLSL